MSRAGVAARLMAMTTLAGTPTVTARPVPRWATTAAHLVALSAVPSGIWRICLGLGLPIGFPVAMLERDHMPGSGTLYVVVLTLLTEAFALLAFGLVQPWGERIPRWVPLLGGRLLHPLMAVVPAGLGALALVVLWTPRVFRWTFVPGGLPDGMSAGGWSALMIACYVPLLAWGPLLAAVTVAYYRRRRQEQR